MQGKQQSCSLLFGTISRAASAAMALPIALALAAILTQSAQAQTFQVLHNFTGGLDGGNPCAGLTIDAVENLYGTTSETDCGSGEGNAGTVFRLTNKGSGWVFTPLHTFRGGSGGGGPVARVVIGPDGSLYGTTSLGGSSGAGTVFNLKPATSVSPNISGSWTETVLYSFQGGSDGANPFLGDLVFDQAGNIYGTTPYGGAYGQGTIYKLAPSPGGWTESVLYSFTGGSDGGWPISGVIIDQTGNLYGTTFNGGGYYNCVYGPCGTIFELTPSGSGWTEHTLHLFQGGNDGGNPIGGLIFGPGGYLYGTTSENGSLGGGTVFALSSWLGSYGLSGGSQGYPPGPWASLVMDTAGNLYGTTYSDGVDSQGSIFKMTVSCGCGGCYWYYSELYNFAGGSDGANPSSSLVVDANGDLYGTTSLGGGSGYGVIFKITQAGASKIAPADPACSNGQ